MNSESGQPEPIPVDSESGEALRTEPVIPEIKSEPTQPNTYNVDDDAEIEVLKNQFFAENPNLAKLTWEGAEVEAESVNNFKFADNTFDDDDFVSEAGGKIVLQFLVPSQL